MNGLKRYGLRVLLGALAVSLVLAACTKKNPSSPGSAPGSKVVFHDLAPRVSGERKVAVTGRVYNQSGLTIYKVRVGMITYFRTDSLGNFTLLNDTSSVDSLVADSLPNKTESGTFYFKFVGDSLISIFPVYTHNPY